MLTRRTENWDLGAMRKDKELLVRALKALPFEFSRNHNTVLRSRILRYLKLCGRSTVNAHAASLKLTVVLPEHIKGDAAAVDELILRTVSEGYFTGKLYFACNAHSASRL